MKKIILASVLVSLALTAALGSIAFAADIPLIPAPTTITTQSGFLTILTIILNWVFTIFIILAIIFVILAGIKFVTEGGDPAKISEARQQLIWAAIGIIIALIARGLPAVINNIIGGTGTVGL